jgi:rRNA-processing protein FCF1
MELDAILNRSYELILPTFVIDELEKISQNRNKKPKTRTEARFALKLAQELCQEYPQELSSVVSVDEQIVTLAKELEAIVATNDQILRTTLKREGIPTIYLRGKNRLEISPTRNL